MPLTHGKLTLDQGRIIRTRHAQGETISSISRAYGVTIQSVKRILRLQVHAYCWNQAVRDDQWDWMWARLQSGQFASTAELVRSLIDKAMTSEEKP